MESWDDDNFEAPEIKVQPVASNKWEGEDEDDDVKDCWEDEEEENDKSSKSDDAPVAVAKPKKKTLQERIAEKERLKREELERRLKEQEEDITPEERLRRQKESDLKLALETTFVDENNTDLGIDSLVPTTKAEFDDLANALNKKITPLSKSIEYPGFAENLVRSICATLTSHDVKKIKTTIDNMYLEKQKMEKGDKTKKNKGKGKVKLKVEDSNQYSAYAVEEYDDFDDFM